MDELDKEIYRSAIALFRSEARSSVIGKYRLFLLSKDLKEKHGYPNGEDFDAIRKYLMEKHHWPPSVVKSMSWSDLEMACSEELAEQGALGEELALLDEPES